MITQSRFRGYSARKNLSPSSSLTLFDPSKINKNAAKNQQGTPGTLTLLNILILSLPLIFYIRFPLTSFIFVFVKF